MFVCLLGSSCGALHAAYISVIIVLLIVTVALSFALWRMRNRHGEKCARCGDFIAMVSDMSYTRCNREAMYVNKTRVTYWSITTEKNVVLSLDLWQKNYIMFSHFASRNLAISCIK